MEWRPVLDVFVPGVPAPQGSKRGYSHVGTTRVQLVESSPKVAPWREAVVAACRTARVKPISPIATDCIVRITFIFARPKTVTRAFPTAAEGDIDKLLRSTYDGLADAGVLANDKYIVGGAQTKRYTQPGEIPGARIRIALIS